MKKEMQNILAYFGKRKEVVTLTMVLLLTHNVQWLIRHAVHDLTIRLSRFQQYRFFLQRTERVGRDRSHPNSALLSGATCHRFSLSAKVYSA